MKKLVIIFLLLSSVFAASNSTISFQGKLLDSTGAAITATKAMTYTLYTAQTGGSQIGSAISLPSVVVNNGVYSVELDVSTVTLPDDVWVAVSVGGEILSPRIHLNSSAFAQKAVTANYAVTANQLSNGVLVSTNGNVGIGAMAPAHKLTVGANTSDAQQVTIRGYSNTPPSWKGGAAFGYTSASVIMGELSGFAQIGGHGPTLNSWANLILNSAGGNVGIGTTDPGTYKLKVAGPGVMQIDAQNTWGGLLKLGGTGGAITNPLEAQAQSTNGNLHLDAASGKLIYLNYYNGTAAPGHAVIIDANGKMGIGTEPNAVGWIYVAGGAYCNGPTWVNASDRVLKEKIQPMKKYGLDAVMAMQPMTYIYKKDKEKKQQVGFIAQDMKKIVPEVVDGVEGSMGISYGNLVPVLVNAIKEQQAMIDKQQKQIELLEKKIDKLEKQK